MHAGRRQTQSWNIKFQERKQKLYVYLPLENEWKCVVLEYQGCRTTTTILNAAVTGWIFILRMKPMKFEFCAVLEAEETR